MTSVDTFVKERNLEHVSFIKIDVQGYELAVCEGMRSTLERFPGACICIEYSPESLHELGFAPEKVLDFFGVRGNRRYVLSRALIEAAPHNFVVGRSSQKAGNVDLA